MTLQKDLFYGLIATFVGVGIIAYLGSIEGFGWFASLGGALAIGAGIFVASLAVVKLVKKAIKF